MANLTIKDLTETLDEALKNCGGKEGLARAPILFRLRGEDTAISNLFGIYMVVFGMIPRVDPSGKWLNYAFLNLMDGELRFGFNPECEIELIDAELCVHEWCLEDGERITHEICKRQSGLLKIRKGRQINHYLKGGVPFDPEILLRGIVRKPVFNLVICGSTKQEELMAELTDDLQKRMAETELRITRPIRCKSLNHVQQRHIAAIAEADLVLIVHKNDRTIGESTSYEKNLARMFDKPIYDLYEGGDTKELSVRSTEQAFTWFKQEETLLGDQIVRQYEEGLFRIIDRWVESRGLPRTYAAVIAGRTLERSDTSKNEVRDEKMDSDNESAVCPFTYF